MKKLILLSILLVVGCAHKPPIATFYVGMTEEEFQMKNPNIDRIDMIDISGEEKGFIAGFIAGLVTGFIAGERFRQFFTYVPWADRAHISATQYGIPLNPKHKFGPDWPSIYIFSRPGHSA